MPDTKVDIAVKQAVKRVRSRLNTEEPPARVVEAPPHSSLRSRDLDDAYGRGYNQGAHDTQEAILEWVAEEIKEIHIQTRAEILAEICGPMSAFSMYRIEEGPLCGFLH